MPLWDDRESIWMLPGYLDGIKEAGGLPIIFPMTTDDREIEQLCGMCTGFLFTGGHDVSTELYHEEPISGMVDACKARDDMELKVLDIALKQDKAVLGICRGIQFINLRMPILKVDQNQKTYLILQVLGEIPDTCRIFLSI